MKRFKPMLIPIIILVLVIVNTSNSKTSGSVTGKDKKLDLYLTFKEFDINSNTAIVDARLSYTKVMEKVISKKVDMRINSGEVSQINESVFAYNKTGVKRTAFTFFDNPNQIRVVASGNINEIIYDQESFRIEVDDIVSSNYFPFDRYKVNLHFTLFDSIGRVLNPNIHYEFQDPHLKIHSVSKAKNKSFSLLPISSNKEIDSSLSFKLSRSWNNILLFCSVLGLALSVVFWVYFQIRDKSKTNDSNFEILVLNISLILTFPDLRNFVIPSNLNFSMFFDYSTIFIWIITIYSTFLLLKHQAKFTPSNDTIGCEINKVNEELAGEEIKNTDNYKVINPNKANEENN